MKEVKEYLSKEKFEEFKKELEFLKRQNAEYKLLCEKIGSESASWKHKYLRMEEEYNKLKR